VTRSSGDLQPLGPIGIIRETIAKKGIKGIYAGCTALVAGNAVKAGVRFLSYDQYKSMLKDADVSMHCISPLDAMLTVIDAGSIIMADTASNLLLANRESSALLAVFSVSMPPIVADTGLRPILIHGTSHVHVHLAGLGAGLTEAVFAVTPSETIKCAFSEIQDALTDRG
jgi:hypothetical protein